MDDAGLITSPGGTVAISSLGWVDHDALWRFDSASGTVTTIPLGSGARWVSVHHSGSPYFAVAHHFDAPKFLVTVHAFDRSGEIVARARADETGDAIEGDGRIWRSVPEVYTTYLRYAPWRDYVLVRIAADPLAVTLQRFEWFDATFDKSYQGIVHALRVESEESAVVSVARSSDLIIHDLATGRRKDTVRLGERMGNPHLEFRTATELWATDYDTVVVVDVETRGAIRARRLQDAPWGTQQFIGGFSFAPDEDVCWVARPFSRDVLVIDTATLKPRRSSPVGGQPFDVAALGRGRFVARDWKTGALLTV